MNFPRSILIRHDLQDIFNQLAVASMSRATLNGEKSRSAPELSEMAVKRKIGNPREKDMFFFALNFAKSIDFQDS